MKKQYLHLCFKLSSTVIDALGEEQGTNAVWLPMIPAGEVKGRDGRTWQNSNPDGIVAAFDTKLPFDVEHATEIKAPDGEAAPAVGWIVALENRDGEIWAQVEWNYQGRWYIEDKQYLFYSPAFYDDGNGVITLMSSAGLTNKPNFYVPSLNREKDQKVKLPKLIADALGLSEEATPEQAVVAINSMKNERDVALNRAGSVDLNKFVPMETHQVALNRAQDAEGKLKAIADEEIDALVQSAIDDGKVAPANKEMFANMCRAEGGVDDFKKYLNTQPSIATNRQTKTPSKPQEGELTPDEVALCRAMNVSEESWKAARHHKPTY